MTSDPPPPDADPRHTRADAPEISSSDFRDGILFENDRVLAVDKPGWLVCHPSKAGPGSSLVGAAKRYLGLDRLHLVSRLDRETSGIVVLAKDRGAARTIQMAVETEGSARATPPFWRASLNPRPSSKPASSRTAAAKYG